MTNIFYRIIFIDKYLYIIIYTSNRTTAVTQVNLGKFFKVASEIYPKYVQDIIRTTKFWDSSLGKILLYITLPIPSLFIASWLFVSTGLAYDVFGSPRLNEYFTVR